MRMKNLNLLKMDKSEERSLNLYLPNLYSNKKRNENTWSVSS